MKNIILVGLMGAGKTTVGRRLSQKIGWEFVDTDTLVEKNCGTSVNVIFEVEGEKGFEFVGKYNNIIRMKIKRTVNTSKTWLGRLRYQGYNPIKKENGQYEAVLLVQQ